MIRQVERLIPTGPLTCEALREKEPALHGRGSPMRGTGSPN